MCISGALNGIEAINAPVDAWSHLWAQLVALWEPSTACLTAADLLGKAIMQVTKLIEDNAEQWAREDFLKAEGLLRTAPSGKRARTASYVRKAVLEEQLQAGKANKASSIVKVLALGERDSVIRWGAKALADMQAAARLSFSIPAVVSWCLDAAQIGKPHRDLLLICQTCPLVQQHGHCILPPQEAWLLLERLL